MRAARSAGEERATPRRAHIGSRSECVSRSRTAAGLWSRSCVFGGDGGIEEVPGAAGPVPELPGNGGGGGVARGLDRVFDTELDE